MLILNDINETATCLHIDRSHLTMNNLYFMAIIISNRLMSIPYLFLKDFKWKEREGVEKVTEINHGQMVYDT